MGEGRRENKENDEGKVGKEESAEDEGHESGLAGSYKMLSIK